MRFMCLDFLNWIIFYCRTPSGVLFITRHREVLKQIPRGKPLTVIIVSLFAVGEQRPEGAVGDQSRGVPGAEERRARRGVWKHLSVSARHQQRPEPKEELVCSLSSEQQTGPTIDFQCTHIHMEEQNTGWIISENSIFMFLQISVVLCSSFEPRGRQPSSLHPEPL